MTLRSDAVKGWSASIALHALLLLLFFTLHVTTTDITFPEEILLTVTEPPLEQPPPLHTVTPARTTPLVSPPVKPSTVQPAQPIRNTPAATPRTTTTQTQRTTQTPTPSATTPVAPRRGAESAIPERRFDKQSPNVVTSPATGQQSQEKERAGSLTPSNAQTQRDVGTKATPSTETSRTTATGLPSPIIEWSNGLPSRRRIAGSLPSYPEGANREVTIAVRLVVAPDGSIKQVTFVRKGEPRFEERVLAAVNGWKFNKLPSDVAQQDQTGTATFRFTLR